MELSDRLSAIEEAQDLLREAKLLIETANNWYRINTNC